MTQLQHIRWAARKQQIYYEETCCMYNIYKTSAYIYTEDKASKTDIYFKHPDIFSATRKQL